MTGGHVEVARRGRRPRTRELRSDSALVRRNLLVNPQAVEQLRLLYGTPSDSAAIRRAVDLALLAAQAEELGAWLSARGGPVDAYSRTTDHSRLPVHPQDTQGSGDGDQEIDAADDARS
jgi:hypothetical protein